MAPPAWFRSPDWGEAAERDFRHRLARARPHNQIQYRRIKAVALLETRDPAKATAGRRLLIEHRLFSAISQNWRAKPLVSHEVIVNLIAATTTRTGLRVRSELDTNRYAAGRRVSDADMQTLYLQPDTFHGEWNYSLLPRLMLPQV
ncbi:hypothetical protein BH23CHL10_BH23CHL10_13510 [soil metagenome]